MLDPHPPPSSHNSTFQSIAKETLNRFELKSALRAAVVATLSFFAGLAFGKLIDRPDTFVSSIWTVVTAIVVSQPHLGGTYKAAWQRFLGIFIGSVLGAFFTVFLGSGPIPLGISVFFTACACTAFYLKDSIKIASLSVAVIMILWGMRPNVDPQTFALYRFLDSTLGIIVAMAVDHVLWPSQATHKLQMNVSHTLKSLGRLLSISVNLDAPIDKQDKEADRIAAEIDDTLKESKSYVDEARLELLTRRSSADDWTLLIHSQEGIFDTLTRLKALPKDKLALMLDDSLISMLKGVVDATTQIFEGLSKELEYEESPHTADMQNALDFSLRSLQNDLLRFRGTRTTRKFDLQDVEGFFVFFYSVQSVAQAASKMISLVSKIKES